MINKKIYRLSLGVLLTCWLTTGLFAQTVVVGEVGNGSGVITNVTEATRVLKSGLSSAATVSDLAIVWDQERSKYFLIGAIKNDAISAKGVGLEQQGTQLAAVAGPGVEIDCIGRDCNSCRLVIRQWRLMCVCDELNGGESSRCDMTYRFVLTL